MKVVITEGFISDFWIPKYAACAHFAAGEDHGGVAAGD
jgi:hypothetical protein